MKQFGIVLAVGALTALLAYFVIPQILSATLVVIVLSNSLTNGIFWIGLFFGEISAGVLTLKLLGRWMSRNDNEPVQDNAEEIQKLFDEFLDD